MLGTQFAHKQRKEKEYRKGRKEKREGSLLDSWTVLESIAIIEFLLSNIISIIKDDIFFN